MNLRILDILPDINQEHINLFSRPPQNPGK